MKNKTTNILALIMLIIILITIYYHKTQDYNYIEHIEPTTAQIKAIYSNDHQNIIIIELPDTTRIATKVTHTDFYNKCPLINDTWTCYKDTKNQWYFIKRITKETK